MKIDDWGIAASFGDLDGGTCFAFRRGKTTYLGLKLGTGSEPDLFVVLWPGHPRTGKVSLLSKHAIEGGVVFVISGAVFVPGFPVSELVFGGDEYVTDGSALLCGDRVVIALTTTNNPDRRLAVAVVSGELLNDFPAGHRVVFRSWSIAVERHEKLEVLADWPVKEKAPPERG
jgi:hypothetical protein